MMKNGTNRNVNKSNSYHQLQSQILASEFGFIPSIAAKIVQTTNNDKE